MKTQLNNELTLNKNEFDKRIWDSIEVGWAKSLVATENWLF